jgi:hypothetical protein
MKATTRLLTRLLWIAVILFVERSAGSRRRTAGATSGNAHNNQAAIGNYTNPARSPIHFGTESNFSPTGTTASES